MLKLFIDCEKYLSSMGINLPIWIFWTLFIITVFSFITIGYKKYIRPIIKEIEKIEKKINRVDEIDSEIQGIKDTQKKAIDKSIAADDELSKELTIINEKVDKVIGMFINKQINDMRQEILGFGNGLINGKKYDKESYDHILDVYNDYEKILKENDMKNGRVTTTMEIIQESYKSFLHINN